MPRIVDRAVRRTEVADAVFRVVRRGGLREATLSNVADEAGLAIGSVRHFTGRHADLIAFAFDVMVERVERRVAERVSQVQAALDDGGLTAEERLEAVVDVLCELVPLDEERRDEATVWVDFEVAARTDPDLAARSARAAAGVGALVRAVLSGARQRGTVSADIAMDVEVQRLAALVDGLTIRAVLHPDLLDAGTARRVLTRHLEELRAGAAESATRT